MEIVSKDLLDLLTKYPKKTCFVIFENKVIFTSEYNGVRPLMEYIANESNTSKPIVVVDRIIGKGAMLLAIIAGANKVVTPIISESALSLGKKYNVKVESLKIVPYIINRNNDGQCPIEKSVENIDDLDIGYKTIKNTIAELMK